MKKLDLTALDASTGAEVATVKVNNWTTVLVFCSLVRGDSM